MDPDLRPETPVIGEAEYLLETPLKCSHCGGEIQSVLVIRLLRERVNFVSTLPRRGYAMVCPLCQSILTMALG